MIRLCIIIEISTMSSTAPENIKYVKPEIRMDIPECTPKEYAIRSGRSLSTVRRLISENALPTIQYGKEKQGSIMINLVKLAERNLLQQ